MYNVINLVHRLFQSCFISHITDKIAHTRIIKYLLHLELLWGAILLIVGLLCMLCFIGLCSFEGFNTEYMTLGIIFGIIPIGIGAGLLVAHSNGKKTMEKNKAQS